jgi:excisionase family DNA binding protein
MAARVHIALEHAASIGYRVADLTIQDVADELSVSSRTVRRLLDAGELAYYRVRRGVRVEPADLQDYKRRNKWQSGSAAAGMQSSSSFGNIVFSDGSQPARRKDRPKRLKPASVAS